MRVQGIVLRAATALAIVAGLTVSSSSQSGSSTSTLALPPGTMGGTPTLPGSPATGTGIVIGRVVDMTTGRPVAGAAVTIGSTSMMTTTSQFVGGPSLQTFTPGAIDGAQRASDLRILTDSQGRFAFLDLPKGSFQFGVAMSGYLGGGYGMRRPGGAAQPLELGDGQHVTDITLPLWRYGAIGGTVLDEAGEPVVGMTVTLLRWQLIAGRRQLGPSGQSSATDDRGVYRIGLLVPGEYVPVAAVSQSTKPLALIQEGVPASAPVPASVAAMLPGSASAVQVGSQVLRLGNVVGPIPAATGRVMTYQTVFYPAARTPAEGTVVTLAGGEERGNIDLQLRLTPAVRVSGTVAGPAGVIPRLAMRLVPVGLDDLTSDAGFEAASTTADATGAFLFVAVPPGRYNLRGVSGPAPPSGPTIIAFPGAAPTPIRLNSSAPVSTSGTTATVYVDLPLSVGDQDITNLAVTMRAGAQVSGTLQFDGMKERPPSDAFKAIGFTVSPADAHAVSTSGVPATRAVFDPSGRASTGGLPPGRYLINASGAPSGWTFKAALYDGRDLSSSPLELGSTDVSGLTVIFTDRTSEIAGTVQTASGAGDPDATVLLFPADDRLWTDSGGSPRRMKTMRVTKTGGFTIAAVPEGDYYVAAVRDDVMGAWPDPAFLLSLRPSATRVSIADGDRKTVNLRTSR